MTYEISPSTLKGATDDRFACHRCFWLKVKHDVRPPEMAGLGKLHHDIHRMIYDYLERSWIDLLPSGRLIETELEVRACPTNGIQLWGYLDGLIRLDSGGHMIIDLKTTQNTDWLAKNYSLQINIYRYCLENAAAGYPAYDVERMGILAFSPNRFAMRTSENAGIAGCLTWVEIPRADRIIGQAVGDALTILSAENPPASNPECEFCAYFERMLKKLLPEEVCGSCMPEEVCSKLPR